MTTINRGKRNNDENNNGQNPADSKCAIIDNDSNHSGNNVSQVNG